MDDRLAQLFGRDVTAVSVRRRVRLGLGRTYQTSRVLGGLTVEETAEVLQIAPITVLREWNKAKLWLHRELARDIQR